MSIFLRKQDFHYLLPVLFVQGRIFNLANNATAEGAKAGKIFFFYFKGEYLLEKMLLFNPSIGHIVLKVESGENL